jgi:hypothetical protein
MYVNPFLYKIVEALFCFGARAYVLKQIIRRLWSGGIYCNYHECNSTFQCKIIILYYLLKIPFQKKEIFQEIFKKII